MEGLEALLAGLASINPTSVLHNGLRDQDPEAQVKILDSMGDVLRDMQKSAVARFGPSAPVVSILSNVDAAASMAAIVRDCLQKHGRTHEGAARAGCVTLAELTSRSAKEPRQRAAEAGAAEAVIGAMRAFPRNLELQTGACGVLGDLLACSGRARELVVSASGVEAVAAALAAAARELGTPSGQRLCGAAHGVLTAATIAAESGAAPTPRPLGGALGDILAGVRAIAASRPDIAESLCRALMQIAADPRRADALRAEDAIETAAKAMRLQPDRLGLQVFSLGVIMNLFTSEDGRQRALDAGAPELAVRALRATEESARLARAEAGALIEVMRAAVLGSLELLCACPLTLPAAAAAGATLAAVKAMTVHPENERTQFSACNAMFRLATFPQERDAVAAAGAVPVVVRALRRFPGNASLAEFGCGALGSLAEERPLHATTVAAEGGVEAVCEALRRHSGSEPVASLAVRALMHLVLPSGGSSAIRLRVAAAGGAELLVAAMRAHPGSGNIGVSGVLALGMLCTVNAVRCVDAGAVEAVCEALRPHPSSPQAIGFCSLALYNACLGCPTAARRAREAGAVGLLFRAWEAFPGNETVLKHCVQALGPIALGDPESERVLKKMGFEVRANPQAARPGEAASSAPPPPPRAPARVCRNCGAVAGGFDPQGQPVRKLRACGGCRAVHYCSVECSKKDWKAHNQTCNKPQEEQQG